MTRHLLKRVQIWGVVLTPLALLVLLALAVLSASNRILNEVGRVVLGLGNIDVIGYLWYASVIGFVTMAAIQMTRHLLPIRGAFHRWRAKRWLAEGIEEAEDPEAEAGSSAPSAQREPTEVRASKALDMLVQLAVSRRSEELFDLPIEQLCGQVNAVAEKLLQAPVGGSEGGASSGAEEDLDSSYDWLLWGLAGRIGAYRAIKYRKAWKKELERQRKVERRQEKNERSESAAFLLHRDALAHSMQRNIDGFQISTGQQWRRCLRFLAAVVSALLAWGLTAASQQAVPFRIVSVVMIGLTGGFVATVARDIVAAVERLRS